MCYPCRYTIQEGLGRRIPWPGRVRYHAAESARRVRSTLGRVKRAVTGRAAPSH